MTALNLFIPITKIDKAKRLVYGRLSQEVADKSGEILDYESSKPAFQKWSDDQFKASGGKSKGNLRAMHDKIAAGIFTDISFDDDSLSIQGCAKVVDDAEWNKVETGTYTGFSIGGGYAKRWKDPDNAALTRYTPELAEVSLVDNPCVPTATFEFIKEDGSTEMRKFNSPNKEQPVMEKTETDTAAAAETTEASQTAAVEAEKAATKERPQDKGGVVQKWVAKDGSHHMTKAEALQRNVEVDAEEGAKTTAAPALDALEKLNAALTKKEGEADATSGEAAEADKAAVEESKPEEKPAEAEQAEKAAETEDLKKGMYTVASFAQLLESIVYLQQDAQWEAQWEGDNSEMPAKLKAWLSDGAKLLTEMVGEEAAELTAAKAAEAAELAKRGAAISATNKEHIEKMYKSACGHMDEMGKCYKALGMGEEDGEEAAKNDGGDLAKVTAERDSATAAQKALAKTIDAMTPAIETLLKRVEDLEKQPMPPKGSVRAVEKGDAQPTDDDVLALLKGKSPEQVNMLLMKAALANPVIHVR